MKVFVFGALLLQTLNAQVEDLDVLPDAAATASDTPSLVPVVPAAEPLGVVPDPSTTGVIPVVAATDPIGVIPDPSATESLTAVPDVSATDAPVSLPEVSATDVSSLVAEPLAADPTATDAAPTDTTAALPDVSATDTLGAVPEIPATDLPLSDASGVLPDAAAATDTASVPDVSATDVLSVVSDVSATDALPTDALPTDALPTDALPTDALPTDALPTDALPTDALPTDALPTDALPTDALPTDALPTDALPTDFPTDFPAIPLLPNPDVGVTSLPDVDALGAAPTATDDLGAVPEVAATNSLGEFLDLLPTDTVGAVTDAPADVATDLPLPTGGDTIDFLPLNFTIIDELAPTPPAPTLAPLLIPGVDAPSEADLLGGSTIIEVSTTTDPFALPIGTADVILDVTPTDEFGEPTIIDDFGLGGVPTEEPTLTEPLGWPENATLPVDAVPEVPTVDLGLGASATDAGFAPLGADATPTIDLLDILLPEATDILLFPENVTIPFDAIPAVPTVDLGQGATATDAGFAPLGADATPTDDGLGTLPPEATEILLWPDNFTTGSNDWIAQATELADNLIPPQPGVTAGLGPAVTILPGTTVPGIIGQSFEGGTNAQAAGGSKGSGKGGRWGSEDNGVYDGEDYGEDDDDTRWGRPGSKSPRPTGKGGYETDPEDEDCPWWCYERHENEDGNDYPADEDEYPTDDEYPEGDDNDYPNEDDDGEGNADDDDDTEGPVVKQPGKKSPGPKTSLHRRQEPASGGFAGFNWPAAGSGSGKQAKQGKQGKQDWRDDEEEEEEGDSGRDYEDEEDEDDIPDWLYQMAGKRPGPKPKCPKKCYDKPTSTTQWTPRPTWTRTRRPYTSTPESYYPWTSDDTYETTTITRTTLVTKTRTRRPYAPSYSPSYPPSDPSSDPPSYPPSYPPSDEPFPPVPEENIDWTGDTLASVCPKTCYPFDPRLNFCDNQTTGCTTTGGSNYYCACRAGFLASGWNAKDFSKQFRVEGQPYVYVAPGVVCDQPCSDTSCSEVLVRDHCK